MSYCKKLMLKTMQTVSILLISTYTLILYANLLLFL